MGGGGEIAVGRYDPYGVPEIGALNWPHLGSSTDTYVSGYPSRQMIGFRISVKAHETLM
jgi:hypothetical protein